MPPVPRTQLELEIGAEALRKERITDALAGLARYAYRARLAVDLESMADVAGIDSEMVAHAADRLVTGLSDRDVAALVGSSPTLAGRRYPGVRATDSEADQGRARLRALTLRIIGRGLREEL
jgi:hypothetical protein